MEACRLQLRWIIEFVRLFKDQCFIFVRKRGGYVCWSDRDYHMYGWMDRVVLGWLEDGGTEVEIFGLLWETESLENVLAEKEKQPRGYERGQQG